MNAMTDEDLFAEKFDDFAVATRSAYPSLFKRAFRLYQKGVPTFGLLPVLIQTLQQDLIKNPVLASNYPKFMHPVFESLINYTELLFKYPKGPERARAARKVMQSAIDEKRLMKQKVTCKKNCSACCHMKPYAAESEVDLIKEYVTEKALPVNLDRLRKQRGTNNREHMTKLSWEDSACVFLSPEGACTIYPVRPLTCMKHLVVGDPKECDVRTSNFNVQVGFIQKAEILASALLNIETAEGKDTSESLPDLLLKKFDGE